uniref:Ribosomal protein L13 n=1 Tax=Spumella sp. NIES-1846 TaxID=2490549 RepID=A0A455RET3_9STRA|nr:ribosomal protein L13 [Spumella sp. NIES-1846]
MKTIILKNEYLKHKIYTINATGYFLGRLITIISQLVKGKILNLYTNTLLPKIYIIVYNIKHILISGKKSFQKLYYFSSQRPGNLKKKTYNQLFLYSPYKILKYSILKMLTKNKLKKKFLNYIYLYSKNLSKIFINHKNINFLKLKYA